MDGVPGGHGPAREEPERFEAIGGDGGGASACDAVDGGAQGVDLRADETEEGELED